MGCEARGRVELQHVATAERRHAEVHARHATAADRRVCVNGDLAQVLDALHAHDVEERIKVALAKKG